MKRIEYTGIALDKLMDDDTTKLRVWIPELSPFTVDDPTEEVIVSTKPRNLAPNGKSSTDVTAVSYVVCEYYGNTNISRPNVHPGEQVKVHMIGDNHEYFWDVIGRSDHLRTTEHVKLVVADKPSQLDPLDIPTMYFVEIDTRAGQRNVHLKTSKGTGETVEYDVRIDLEEYFVRMMDSVGNFTELISLEEKFHTENATGDHTEIVPNKITSKLANGDHIVITPDSIEAKIASGDAINIAPNMIKHAIASGDSVTITPGTTVIDNALTVCTGNLVVTNAVTCASAGVSGTMTGGKIIGAGIVVSTHTHGHSGYRGITTPPK